MAYRGTGACVGPPYTLAMQPFQFRDGHLHADPVPVARIAELAGTPTYIYSASARTEL